MPTGEKAGIKNHALFFSFFVLSIVLVVLGMLLFRNFRRSAFYNRQIGVTPPIDTVSNESPNKTPKESAFRDLALSEKVEKDSLSGYVPEDMGVMESNSMYYDDVLVSALDSDKNFITISLTPDYSREFHFASYGNATLMSIDTSGSTSFVTVAESGLSVGDTVIVSELIDASRVQAAGGKRFAVIINNYD